MDCNHIIGYCNEELIYADDDKHDFDVMFNFCPNCGVDLIEPIEPEAGTCIVHGYAWPCPSCVVLR